MLTYEELFKNYDIILSACKKQKNYKVEDYLMNYLAEDGIWIESKAVEFSENELKEAINFFVNKMGYPQSAFEELL